MPNSVTFTSSVYQVFFDPATGCLISSNQESSLNAIFVQGSAYDGTSFATNKRHVTVPAGPVAAFATIEAYDNSVAIGFSEWADTGAPMRTFLPTLSNSLVVPRVASFRTYCRHSAPTDQ